MQQNHSEMQQNNHIDNKVSPPTAPHSSTHPIFTQNIFSEEAVDYYTRQRKQSASPSFILPPFPYLLWLLLCLLMLGIILLAIFLARTGTLSPVFSSFSQGII